MSLSHELAQLAICVHHVCTYVMYNPSFSESIINTLALNYLQLLVLAVRIYTLVHLLFQ